MTWFKSKRLSFKIGIILAIIHLSLVIYVISLIVSGIEPDWPMYWLIFMGLDFPFSLLNILLSGPAYVINFDFLINFLSYPINDFDNFMLPAIFFGIFGTLWYFLLPILIANIAKKKRGIK